MLNNANAMPLLALYHNYGSSPVGQHVEVGNSLRHRVVLVPDWRRSRVLGISRRKHVAQQITRLMCRQRLLRNQFW